MKWIWPLLFAHLFISSPCAFAESHDGPGKIELGALLCLSGSCADWGTAALRGAKLAIDEINSQGSPSNHTYSIKVEDTRESVSGAEAVNAFKKLVDVNGLKFIIGPSWAPGALAIAPLAAKNTDILLITPSASAEEFSKAGPNLFNARPAERLATEKLANFALRRGWKRGAVFTSQQPAESTQGRIFRDEFKRLGGNIVKYIETTPSTTDLKPEALQIVSSNPEVIFLMAYNQLDLASTALRNLGFKGQVLAIDVDEAHLASAKGAIEGAYIANTPPPNAEFKTKFQNTFHESPGLSAENGYDAVMALSKAIALAHTTDRAAVASALAKLELSGASGEIKFNQNRTIVLEPKLFKVEADKIVPAQW